MNNNKSTQLRKENDKMRRIEKVNGELKTVTYEFNSIGEFDSYLEHTSNNEVFKYDNHCQSKLGLNDFTKTYSYEQARDYLLHGHSASVKRITENIKMTNNLNVEKVFKDMNVLDVVGYQPIVPLYLMGVPNNMINKKKVMVKQKVVTINKCITYAAVCSTEKIFEESIKALSIVKKIEETGIRCNLNVIFAAETKDKRFALAVKIRIKSANERLNLVKTAFPLTHPSFLRRCCFKFIEKCPETPKEFIASYGRATVVKNKPLMNMVLDNDKEYFLPAVFDQQLDDINSLQDIANIENYGNWK